MYAGEIVERGTAEESFYAAAHPYTQGLRAAMPSEDASRAVGLKPIEGAPPDLFDPPIGCGYFPRCPHAMRLCEQHRPPSFALGATQRACCWLHAAAAPNTVTDVQRGARP
jgi:oligopeptide transport system ATP-binding protein